MGSVGNGIFCVPKCDATNLAAINMDKLPFNG